MYSLEQLQQKNIKQLKEIGWQVNVMPEADKRCRQNWIDAIVGVNPPLLQLLEVSPAASVEQAQGSIAPAVKNSPGVEVDRVSEAIEQVAKNSLDAEPDPNPILIGIALSERFVARYSPPQPWIIYFQSDAGGQLSLLNFEIEFAPEPPDPDDFESLDAFREAIARWDKEHPNPFDQCSYLPSSAHCEQLEVSLDSFCEWAPCPAYWYELTAAEPSKVMELLPVSKKSSTSDFFIPTFDAVVRSVQPKRRTARYRDLCKIAQTKTPHLSPIKSITSQLQVNQVSRNYPETIPKLFHRIVAGSSTQPARSPPGGDASSA